MTLLAVYWNHTHCACTFLWTSAIKPTSFNLQILKCSILDIYKILEDHTTRPHYSFTLKDPSLAPFQVKYTTHETPRDGNQSCLVPFYFNSISLLGELCLCIKIPRPHGSQVSNNTTQTRFGKVFIFPIIYNHAKNYVSTHVAQALFATLII